MRRLAVVALFVGLLAVGAAAPAAAASPANNSTDGDGEVTLDELQNGGQQISGAPPSLRWIGEDSGVWIDYVDPNPLQDTGGSEWAAKTLLEPGATVPRNEIRLHRQGTQATADETVTLHVVYWDRGTRTVRGERTTSEEAVAANVTHTTQQIEFDGAFDTATVDLRPHYDRPTEVTMWIEGSEETARWRFTHKSLESTQSIPAWINSQGDLLIWAIMTIVGPGLLFSLVGSGVSLAAVKKAGAGPQKGLVWWGFMFTIAAFVGVLFVFQDLSAIFVRGPWVLAGILGLLTTVMVLEGHEDRVSNVLVERPQIKNAITAGGVVGHDALRTDLADLKIADNGPGESMIVRPGIRPFLARVFGGGAVIDEADLGKTRIDIDHPKYDKKLWVDPESEKPVHFEPAGWEWSPPTSLTEAALPLTMIAAGAIVAQITIGMPWAGTLAGLPALFAATPGFARIEVAPAHFTAAHHTAMFMSGEYDEARTAEEARKVAYSERATTQQQIEERFDERDSSVLEQAMGFEIDPAVTGEVEDREHDDAAELEAVADGGREGDDE